MPLSSEQRHRVLVNIASGRLSLDTPTKMCAGYGQGRACTGCGKVIERSQLEWEAVYEDGRACHLHLGCASLWDAERLRRREDTAAEIRVQAHAIRERARMTSKESAELRERADLLAREAEAVIEESRQVRRRDAAEQEGTEGSA